MKMFFPAKRYRLEQDRKNVEDQIYNFFIQATEDPHATRVAVLHGLAGMGKTYVTKRCCGHLQAIFQVRELSCLGIAWSSIARYIDVILNRTTDLPPSSFIPIYQDTNPILILLDALELDEAAIAGIEELLDSIPTLHLLITTCCIKPWLMPQFFPLNAGLPLAAAKTLFEMTVAKRLANEATVLQEIGELTDYEASVLQEILELTEGIPLVIQFVAFSPVKSLERIRSNLRERPNALSLGNTSSHQQSMGGCIAHSWGYLTDDQKRISFGLSLFAGSFRLENLNALQAMAERNHAPDMITEEGNLTELHLLSESTLDLLETTLEMMKNASLLSIQKKGSNQWYTLSRFVRAFIRDQGRALLDSPEQEYILRYCHFYKEFVQRHAVQDSSPHPLWEWEWDNVREAIQYALDQQYLEIAFLLAIELTRFLLMKADLTGFLKFERTFSYLAKQAQDFSIAGDLCELEAFIALFTLPNGPTKFSFLEAIECYTIAIETLHHLEDYAGKARVQGNLGHLYFQKHIPDKAAEMYRASLDTIRLVDPQKMAPDQKHKALSLLGEIHYSNQQYEAAIQCFNHDLIVSVEMAYPEGIVRTCICLGRAYAAHEDFINAAVHLTRLLDLPLSLADRWQVHGHLADVYRDQGRQFQEADHQANRSPMVQIEAARNYFIQSLEQFELAGRAITSLLEGTLDNEERHRYQALKDKIGGEQVKTCVRLATTFVPGDCRSVIETFQSARHIAIMLPNSQELLRYIAEMEAKTGCY